MREILAADPLNKIILFTTIEQTSTQVWEYLTKILKLANLPFIAPTRATCGKKVFDFDVSEDTKVFLFRCTFSYILQICRFFYVPYHFVQMVLI